MSDDNAAEPRPSSDSIKRNEIVSAKSDFNFIEKEKENGKSYLLRERHHNQLCVCIEGNPTFFLVSI